MGLPVARASIDYSLTHILLSGSDIHIGPGQTNYQTGAGMNILINGQACVVQDDFNNCGDRVMGCSSTVFVAGKGVHRLTDMMSSHESTYTPSFCVSASSNVFCG